MPTVDTKNNGTHTILYIEDNPVNLKLVIQLLNNITSIKIISAKEPQLGLNIAMEQEVDLILLDINLPGMNGFEVLTYLQQHSKTSDIPVIAISANAMPIDIEQGMSAGFDDYITKPINLKRLLKSISNSLGCNDFYTD
jgi:CheY-like chemotaxis protein